MNPENEMQGQEAAAPAQTPQEPQASQPKHHVSKTIIILLVLIIVLGLASAAKLFFDRQQAQNLSAQEQASQAFVAAYETGDLDAAITLGQQWIMKYPDDAEGYVALASAYLQKGSVEFAEEVNADMAIDLLIKALEIDPMHAEAYRLLGYAYEIKQDYPKALEHYGAAVELDETNAAALVGRGHTYELMGDYLNAEADYISALSYDSANSLALINLASIYLYTDRAAEYDVELMLTQAFEHTNDSRIAAEAKNILATIHAGRGEYATARALFEESLQYDSMLPASWMGRAFADLYLLDAAQTEEAFGQKLQSIYEAIEAALFINEHQTTAFMLQGIIAGTYAADTEAETAFYAEALAAIDNDITLDMDRKEKMRGLIQALIDGVDPDDPALLEIKQEIDLEVNAQ